MGYWKGLDYKLDFFKLNKYKNDNNEILLNKLTTQFLRINEHTKDAICNINNLMVYYFYINSLSYSHEVKSLIYLAYSF